MAVGLGTALLLGGGAALSSGANIFGAYKQKQAADNAAAAAKAAGKKGATAIGAGYDAALGHLTPIPKLHDEQRAIGAQANAQLAALLRGDASGFQASPGYRFRLDQGLDALSKRAAAAGSFGSSGNLRDFNDYASGMASDEYGKYLAQLNNNAALGFNATNAQADAMAQLATLEANRGNSLANAYNNQAAAMNNFNIQGANAIAAGAAGVGNSISSATEQATLLALLGGNSAPVPRAQTQYPLGDYNLNPNLFGVA